MSADFGEQLTFSGLEPKPQRKSSRNSTAGAPKIALAQPVASVLVEKLPIHLDQLFDYLVPEKFADIAVPGALVKVPFGGQQLDGYIVARKETSEHKGRLSPLKSVVSKVPLISDDSLALFRSVAEYYGGSVADVVRLAIPPRHAAAEKAFIERFMVPALDGAVAEAEDATEANESETQIELESAVDPISSEADQPQELFDLTPLIEGWAEYTAGHAFTERLTACATDSAQTMPRAVWTPFPGYGSDGSGKDPFVSVPHWAISLAALAEQVRRSGRRSLIVVPTAKDLNRVREALSLLGLSEGPHEQDATTPGGFVTLSYELSPAQRYGNFLLAKYGKTDIVVGTRAAAFTPIPDLGLAVCWDDSDSSHQDLHAPYPHSREVLSLRSELHNIALVVASFGRSLHAQSLLSSGFAGEISPAREALRVRAPHIVEFGEYEIAADSGGKNGRLPERVWREIRKALTSGPVLIQVPRGGYVPTIACGRCREAARCMNCHGPLGLDSAHAAPQCRWCGALSGNWACDACGFTRIRAIQIGSERTAEELRRAFPGVPVISSAARARDGVVESIAPRPSLVIATPGAEPHVPGGYLLAVLLDAHAASGGSGLYAHQQALALWQSSAALVRSRSAGGQVYLVGRGATLPTSALVRWDGAAMAARELDERTELHLPPSWRVASVSGDRHSVASFLSALNLPQGAETLGPVDVPNPDPHGFDEIPYVRAIVRVPMRLGRELAKGLGAMARIASAKRQTQRVDVVLDPKELL